MAKKLTITLDERVYEGLHRVVGRRRISRFIESLVRPHVVPEDLEVGYRQMAQDEERERKRWNGPKPPTETSPMKRGEVRWVNFEPAVGGEVRRQRPAVIVSNDVSNKHLNRVRVVPLTTAVARFYPSEAPVTVRRKKHKAVADQLTTASKTRLKNRLGRLSKKDVAAVEQAIKTQLGLIP